MGRLVEFAAKLLKFLALIFLGLCAWVQVVGARFDDQTVIRIKEHWLSFLLVVISTIYVAVDVPSRIRNLSPSTVRDRIANYLEMGLTGLRSGLKPLVDNDFKQATERLLLAAQYELEEELGLTGRELIQVNLIWVKVDNATIEVAARSKPGHLMDYPWEIDRLACAAMERNQPVVQSHLRRIKGYENKPYNCVAAVPITHRDKAFGAITVDSTEATTFKNRELLIDRILRPYAAALALTRTKDAVYHTCPARTVRARSLI